MACFKNLIWLSLFFLTCILINVSNCAKLYVLQDDSLAKASPHNRVRRQTHPATTIAKLPTQDNSPFIPIVGPTQPAVPQQSSFSQQNNFFGNSVDFPNLQEVPNTLVDYLIPPSPDSPTTNLNFQDPSANLHQLENDFDITSPTSSSINFEQFQNSFQQLVSNFQNQNPNPNQFQINAPVAPTASNALSNDPAPNSAFQSASSGPPATPSLSHSSPTPATGIGNFFSNKISNPVVNKDSFSHQINNINHPSSNQFSSPVLSTSFPRPEIVQDKQNQLQQQSPQAVGQSQSQQSNQGKWELGYDANEILTPPKDETLGRAGEYNTINVSKFRKPNSNFSPPVLKIESPINQIQPPSQFFNQFIPNLNQFSFNHVPTPQSLTSNDAFIPITNQFPSPNSQTSQNQFTPKEINNDQANVVWGTQKQQPSQVNNFNPTTAAPFLPTIPPSANPQQTPIFHSPQQQTQNFQNGFNPIAPSPATPPQHFQFQSSLQQNQPLFDLNHNYVLDTPLTSQFDTVLPQGTVADHTFQLFNENLRQFQRKKRQVNKDEAEEYDEEPKSNFYFKPIGQPVYSYVKTDRDGHFKWSVRHSRR